MTVKRSAALLILVLAAAACRAGSHTPRGVAERFLDAHYVRIDLAAAKTYCVGVALHKVQEEQRLVGDAVIDESTRQPRVSYAFDKERKEGPERISFLFDGEIRLDDGGRFAVQWLVTTRRQSDGTWKVSNFDEIR